MEIIPFNQLYPSWEVLDNKQKQCFNSINKYLDRNEFIDLQGNISYLFLYIYNQLDNILKYGLKITDDIINKFLMLKELYGHIDKIYSYLDFWIGDLFCLKGDFINSLRYCNLKPGSTSTHLANHVMNIKYELKIDVDAKEILCTNKKLTKFGYEHIDNIVEYCNIILRREKEERKTDYLQYIGNKYKNERRYGIGLFAGYPGGYGLNILFNKQIYSFKTYCFYAIKEFYEFGEKLSRNAENLLREDVNLPKVGEGWVSETELYYRIKSYLKDFEVLNHYSPKWLGRQHLDIFIPKLNIAFEYQGKQHFEPIEYFGGEPGLKEIKKRDRIKKTKCTKNKVKLFYIKEGYDIKQVKVIIDEYIARPRLSSA